MSSENEVSPQITSARLALLGALRGRIVQFAANEMPDAAYLRSEQRTRWRELIDLAASEIDSQILHVLRGRLSEEIDRSCVVDASEKRIDVTSKVQILDQMNPDLLKNISKDKIFLAGFVLYNLLYLLSDQMSSLPLKQFSHIIDYIKFVSLNEAKSEFVNGSDAILKEAMNKLQSLELTLNSRDEDVKNLFNKTEELTKIADEKIILANETIESIVQNGRYSFESALNAVNETIKSRLNFSSASDLWKKKSESARNSYIIFISLFSGLLISGLAGIIFFHDTIVVSVKASDPNLYYYSTLLYIFVILGCAWFLRTLLKIAFQSLHIADEADHRRSLIETFIAFTNESTVNLKENDRFLVLISIFRPLHPVAGDDLTPPTTVDLLKDAVQNIGKKP